MGRIADQIIDIKEKKKASVIGLPDSFTPQDLLVFQYERIRILEVAIMCNENEIKQWIKAVKKRPDGFRNRSEFDLLEIGIDGS